MTKSALTSLLALVLLGCVPKQAKVAPPPSLPPPATPAEVTKHLTDLHAATTRAVETAERDLETKRKALAAVVELTASVGELTEPSVVGAVTGVMELFTGKDTEVEYLLTVHDDGTRELATRPLGGARWGPPTTLTVIPNEVTC